MLRADLLKEKKIKLNEIKEIIFEMNNKKHYNVFY